MLMVMAPTKKKSGASTQHAGAFESEPGDFQWSAAKFSAMLSQALDRVLGVVRLRRERFFCITAIRKDRHRSLPWDSAMIFLPRGAE